MRFLGGWGFGGGDGNEDGGLGGGGGRGGLVELARGGRRGSKSAG